MFSYKQFRQFANIARNELSIDGSDILGLVLVKASIQSQAKTTPFTDDEMTAALENLGSENIAMVTDDTIVFM